MHLSRSRASIFLILALVFLIYSRSHGEDAGTDVSQQLSPQGDISVSVLHTESNDCEVWLVSHSEKKTNPSKFLLCKTDRRPNEIIFSGNQKYILLNQEVSSTKSVIILYRHIKGLEYKKEDIDLTRIFWKSFCDKYGLINDKNEGPFSHRDIKGIAFSENGDALLVSLKGHLGGEDNYLEQWYCIYDFENKKTSFDLNIMNRHSVHAVENIRVKKHGDN